jgi:hypothetical protein
LARVAEARIQRAVGSQPRDTHFDVEAEAVEIGGIGDQNFSVRGERDVCRTAAELRLRLSADAKCGIERAVRIVAIDERREDRDADRRNGAEREDLAVGLDDQCASLAAERFVPSGDVSDPSKARI